MKKISVIAHRGAFLPEGPIPEVQDKYIFPENSFEAFKRASEKSWGIETDVRQKDQDFVLIHDQTRKNFVKQIPTLDQFCKIVGGGFVAFQIKRDNDNGIIIGKAIAKHIQKYNLQNCIVFDATLEEAEILHQEFPWLNLSVSVGEENYSPTIYTPEQVLTQKFCSVFQSIWADEWKISRSIYNQDLFKKLREKYSGRLDVISPELHYNENHPLSKDLGEITKLWKEIISWDIIDGICTDYPTKLTPLVV